MILRTAELPPNWIQFERYEASIPVSEDAPHRVEVVDEEDVAMLVSGPVEDDVIANDNHVIPPMPFNRHHSPRLEPRSRILDQECRGEHMTGSGCEEIDIWARPTPIQTGFLFGGTQDDFSRHAVCPTLHLEARMSSARLIQRSLRQIPVFALRVQREIAPRVVGGFGVVARGGGFDR